MSVLEGPEVSWRGLVVVAVLVALCAGLRRSVAGDLATPRDLHEIAFVGSAQCRRCHADHYASWHDTFHRTMTQEAEAAVGDFDGGRAAYFGWRAEMTREAEGLTITTTAPDGASERVRVDRTVGSHRYQQYLAREGDEWFRLPWAWHVEERRWFHMNGAFLTPDPELASGHARREDHERHVTRWNDNCVFCHNVAPNPGRVGARFDTPNFETPRFETTVAELGVACEACHGPGAEHARVNALPWRRYALHLGDDADPSIVSPARLTPSRSADVCGRCHGQRLTDDIDHVMRHGDEFVPGEDLARYSEPLWGDTTLGGEAVFGARFWADRTPRLTAYEYQGWLQSACTQGGELTCTTCHGMHDGDPSGQLRPEAEGDGACNDCHAMGQDHTRHDTPVPCVDCHMPRVVYGVLDAHRSHRIDSPRPSPARPGACALCHLDMSRDALDRVLAEWSGQEWTGRASPSAMPIGWELAFGGDPIERAIAAVAYGRAQPEDADEVLAAMYRTDRYPAVRILAARARRALGVDFAPDPFATASARAAQAPPTGTPPEEIIDALRARADGVAIEIGE